MAVSSIVASDLVPLKKRALFQGYANTFFAVGSGTGGALGGLLADSVGWRWAFLSEYMSRDLQLSDVLLAVRNTGFEMVAVIKQSRAWRDRVDHGHELGGGGAQTEQGHP